MASDPSEPSYLAGLTFDELVDVLDELENDGPRGAVLLGCSLLDNIIKRILLSRMIQLTNDEDDRLFGGLGPLAGMSSRVAIAYAFGFIDKETKRHLDTIRKLRNRFGHAEKKIDFDDPEAVACCRSLARLVGEEPKTAQERRNVYVHAVRLLIANLPSVINPEATP
jgi:DNA-binding MltR family transcriptional regulator